MTREEIINALQSDKMMPYIQPEQLANIVDFVSENCKPSLPESLDKARFLRVLDQWEEHAIRGMRKGATAYHQGKIALITDLRDWINREG